MQPSDGLGPGVKVKELSSKRIEGVPPGRLNARSSEGVDKSSIVVQRDLALFSRRGPHYDGRIPHANAKSGRERNNHENTYRPPSGFGVTGVPWHWPPAARRGTSPQAIPSAHVVLARAAAVLFSARGFRFRSFETRQDLNSSGSIAQRTSTWVRVDYSRPPQSLRISETQAEVWFRKRHRVASLQTDGTTIGVGSTQATRQSAHGPWACGSTTVAKREYIDIGPLQFPFPRWFPVHLSRSGVYRRMPVWRVTLYLSPAQNAKLFGHESYDAVHYTLLISQHGYRLVHFRYSIATPPPKGRPRTVIAGSGGITRYGKTVRIVLPRACRRA